ncbi:hypothetical protein ACXC9Q_07020 [Kribbella sp. CWNU-51]
MESLVGPEEREQTDRLERARWLVRTDIPRLRAGGLEAAERIASSDR